MASDLGLHCLQNAFSTVGEPVVSYRLKLADRQWIFSLLSRMFLYIIFTIFYGFL